MKKEILNHIKIHGPLPVSTYMAMCLYDSQKGYYMKKMPFGTEGDFITAPELTPLFGEMLGLWVADTWYKFGAPAAFHLVEIGPGRGILALDMLRALKKAAPACLKACRLHLVEVSPHLKAIQEETLKQAPVACTWHQNIQSVPKGVTIALGNEVLDALPVNQYEQKEDGQYYERLVDEKAGTLCFTHATTPTPDLPKASTSILEYSPTMKTFLEDIKTHIQEGALLLLDYGTDNPNGTGETLQAIHNHKHTCIFAAPGQADLSWHINFKYVSDTLGSSTCMCTDMALFLTEIGFPLRAEQAHRAAKTTEEQNHIEHTTRRILDPNQMGRHFKVLGWCTKTPLPLAGFEHCLRK